MVADEKVRYTILHILVMASKILVYSTPEFYSTLHALTLEMESRTFREMRDAALADAEGARAELRNNKSAYEELFLK